MGGGGEAGQPPSLPLLPSARSRMELLVDPVELVLALGEPENMIWSNNLLNG